jgi:hypothetical protein
MCDMPPIIWRKMTFLAFAEAGAICRKGSAAQSMQHSDAEGGFGPLFAETTT